MTPAEFRETDTYKIVYIMQATGNRPGVIARWKENLAAWANDPKQSRNVDAAAVRAWLPHWQVRPFYTAAELAPLWPMLALALGLRERLPNVPRSAGRLANEFKFAGLPLVTPWGYHQRADFNLWRHPATGHPERFYAVERLHHYSAVTVQEDEFYKEFKNA